MLVHQLHHARTPASSCSHASFIMLAHQLHHTRTPASSCSHASFIMLVRQLHLAHAPASSCSRASFILLARQLHHARTPASSCSRASFILLACHQNSITREQNLITRQLILAHASSTIPPKSRSPDVGASGLRIRRKGVDMRPVASSVKGRKVRS